MDTMRELIERLDRMEAAIQVLIERQTVKDWYGTDEVAKLLGKAEFTVREWCRLGRVNAEKRGSGRGRFQSWVISHAELLRLQRDGLLPLGKRAWHSLVLAARCPQSAAPVRQPSVTSETWRLLTHTRT